MPGVEQSRPSDDPDTQVGDAATMSLPPAGPEVPSPGWTLTVGVQTFALHQGVNTIGRRRDATVSLNSPVISREHARVIVDGNNSYIEDLGSKNGTFVGDCRVDLPVQIHDSSAIRLGPVWLTLRSPQV